MPRQVQQFALAWHPRNGTAFRVQTEGAAWSQWVPVPPADLAALAAIFREKPVFVHDNGSITTGAEPIGDLP